MVDVIKKGLYVSCVDLTITKSRDEFEGLFREANVIFSGFSERSGY